MNTPKCVARRGGADYVHGIVSQSTTDRRGYGVSISARRNIQCTQAAEAQPRPQTWARLYVTFGRYGQCDDGSVAEAWSDFVATLLAEHWESLSDLHALTAAYPSFRSEFRYLRLRQKK